MEGPNEDPGVNTRALQQLFKVAEDKGDECELTVHASCLEVYCEVCDASSSGALPARLFLLDSLHVLPPHACALNSRPPTYLASQHACKR